MSEKIREDKRGKIGFGSSYRKAQKGDLGKGQGIGSVLGGQVWMVKPDKEAQAATPCIWMQAGVVEFKSCNNFYDCTTCKYDLGMKKQVEKGKQISWQAAMRKRDSIDRICRHSLTKRIQSRACAYDYECGKCDFDQFFEDVWAMKTESAPSETQNYRGFDMPVGYYFHNGHTWVRIESGGYIRVGMDDFSHKLLGRADSLDLPLMGKELDQGKAGWGFKRQDNDADVLSPVNGVIMEVNSELREKPQLAKAEPYKHGWMFMVRPPDIKKTVKTLMTGTDGIDWISGEVQKLENMIEEVAGPLAADGGFLTDDIYGNLPDLCWDKLTKKFLKS